MPNKLRNNSTNNQSFMAPLKPTTGVQTPGIGNMNWSLPGMSQQNTQQIGPSNYLSPEVAGGGTANTGGGFNTVFNNKPGGGFDWNGYSANDYQTQMPGKEGGWVQPAQMGLGVARIGLDVYNAINQSKMNKFMRSYYGDQMDLMKTDFANAARSSNEALASRQGRINSARGIDPNSAEGEQGVADYMSEWGAKETV